MKPSTHFISSLISIFSFSPCFSQKNPVHNVSEVIELTSNAIDLHKHFHYNAQMRFKEMGGDTFEIRNFNISYKSNDANALYAYDWKISEEVDSGYIYTWMALPEGLYVLFEGNKVIGHNDLPTTIDLGSYPEYIREAFILRERFLPFTNVPPEDLMMKDSGDYYYLTRKMNDFATRQLIIWKNNYLPVQSIDKFWDRPLDLVQITETTFYYNEYVHKIPDTTFSIDHYLTLGYTLKHVEESEPDEQENSIHLSSGQKELLLNYPLVSATGDTSSIIASEAGYLVLDFWYSSCAPCLAALPELNQLAEKYAHKGLMVMGINCFDKGIKETLSEKLRAKKITISLLYGSRDLLETLRINSFPTYILITPDRQVEYIHGSIEMVKSLMDRMYNK